MPHLSPAILDAYAEGMLSPAERAQADAHLAVCAECRLSVISLAQLGDLLRAQPRVEPPTDLAASIVAELEPALTPAAAPIHSLRDLLLSGAGAAIAWLLLVILVGETIVAAYSDGLADFAELVSAKPNILTRYPAEVLYALAGSVPLLEVALTVLVFIAALWLMRRFLAALPDWSRV